MPQTNTCVTNGNLPPDIYTANLATQLTYNINFDFEAEADVVVYREQPAGTFTLLTNSAATGATPPNYTINEGVSPAQVTFNAGEAPGGASLLIGRRTGICDPIVTFQVGAAIRAGDLNASNTQLLHLIQEMRSTLGFMINGNDTDPIIPGQGMDLGDLDDVNLADPIPDPSLLRWNGTDWVNNDVLESGDAWVSDNSTFATTSAGDARWLGGGGTPDVVGGPGVTITPNSPAAGQILVSADLEAAGAGEGGLVFDPNTGNTGEIRVNVSDGLELTANGVAVDLATTSGLEFTSGDLRIDANDGCEIVAAGLNAETTAASIVQTAGTDANPAIRIATTLGADTTNTDLVITGGANTTVTRNSDGELTISSSGGTGLTYRGTVDVTDNATLPTDSNVNDVFANDTQGTQTADWQTVITGASTTANQGDLLLCTTAAGGTALNARYTLIESGTPAGGTPNLQAVTTEGNTSSNNILLQTGDPAVTNTSLNANGSAVFNEQGADVDFRVEGTGQANALVVDGTNGNVGIHEGTPTQPLDVNGNVTVDGTITIEDGNGLVLQNGAEDQTVTINADDATATYDITLPPIAPTDITRFLRAGTTGANTELEWVDIAAGLWEANGGNLRPITDTQGVQIRNGAAVNTTLIGANGSATFNETGAAVDFRVEGDTDANLLFVDGSEDRVGIGTNAPDSTLDVDGQVTITQNAIAAGAGNFDLADGNFWTLGAVVIPNPTNMVAGMSGLIVNTAQATWPIAGGATFQYAANTPPNITEFPAVIPFYCTNNTTIFIGTPTVNIV